MTKKTVQTDKQNPRASLLLGSILLLLSYVFISWAIDSGVLWWYIFTFVALYYAISHLKKFVKLQYFNNGKSKKAK